MLNRDNHIHILSYLLLCSVQELNFNTTNNHSPRETGEPSLQPINPDALTITQKSKFYLPFEVLLISIAFTLSDCY